jgi:hypothetical protein
MSESEKGPKDLSRGRIQINPWLKRTAECRIDAGIIYTYAHVFYESLE